MRWPWMAKATHEAILGSRDAFWKGELDAMRSRLLAIQDRHDAFVLEIASLTKPTQVPVAAPVPKRVPDESDDAIAFIARDNYPLKRELDAYARAERRKGTDPKAIAAEILAMARPREDADEGLL